MKEPKRGVEFRGGAPLTPEELAEFFRPQDYED